MEQLVVPQGTFRLRRYPPRSNERLRAWDAADEYLLAHLAEPEGFTLDGGDGTPVALVIVNDQCGALSTALAQHRPISFTDSFVSQCGTEDNLERNGSGDAGVTVLHSVDPLPSRVDIALIKIPKSAALLEDQLSRLAPSLHATSTVLGAGMAKHIHTSTIQLFERIIGPTRTSLARKKARLIVAHPDSELTGRAYPQAVGQISGPGGLEVRHHAGVFSAGRIDPGTRFLLDHLPETAGPVSIVDLGCGSGVLGTAAALANREAMVTFVDDSFLAVASAQATFRASLDAGRVARFVAADCLGRVASGEPIEHGSVDLILNNPPFHDNHAVGDAIAWRMFQESHAALALGGELWVVGNRHLAYHAKLTRLFGNCDVVASNAKFVILRAIRQPRSQRNEHQL